MLPETEAESARRMRSACAADAKPAAPVNQSGEQIGERAHEQLYLAHRPIYQAKCSGRNRVAVGEAAA